jgi:hypothetical protein
VATSLTMLESYGLSSDESYPPELPPNGEPPDPLLPGSCIEDAVGRRLIRFHRLVA